MKILIATFNKGKQQEHRKILLSLAKKTGKDLSAFLLEDLGIKDRVEEAGETFAENSLLKAKFYFERSKIPTIADDGGLEIPILNNEPGVLSRRWLGYNATDEELINFTLEKMASFKKKEERKANLVVCITYYDGKNTFQETAKIEGELSNQINSNYIKGYPFRALFIVSGLNKYYDQLTPEEHNQYNHRKKALNKLFHKITKLIMYK